MVEHSPKILASEKKATTTTTLPFTWQYEGKSVRKVAFKRGVSLIMVVFYWLSHCSTTSNSKTTWQHWEHTAAGMCYSGNRRRRTASWLVSQPKTKWFKTIPEYSERALGKFHVLERFQYTWMKILFVFTLVTSVAFGDLWRIQSEWYNCDYDDC